MDLDSVRNEYSPGSLNRLHEIATWTSEFVTQELEKGSDLEESARKIGFELQSRYPDLSEEGINNVLVYTHFYLCR